MFVELQTIVEGSGTLPGYYVDYPTYQFNFGSGELKPFDARIGYGPNLLPSQWGFIGIDLELHYFGGGGERSVLTAIETLPFAIQTESPPEGPNFIVTLVAVSEDGQIEIVVNDQQMILKRAAEYWWTKEIEHESSHSDSRGVVSYKGRFRYRYSVTNYGWQDRSRLQTSK